MEAKFAIAVIAALLLLGGTASAAELKSYRVDAFINSDETITSVVTLEFDQPVAHLEYRLNFIISGLQARSSYDFTDCRSENDGAGSIILCDFIGVPSNNEVRLNFQSAGDITKSDEKRQLSIDYTISTQANKRIIAIRLPEGGSLAEEVANMSYFPRHGEIFTDGKRIGILWRLDNPLDEAKFLISYTVPPSSLIIDPPILLMIAVVIMAIAGGFFIYFRKYVAAGKAEAFKAVLNQDEKKIVDILTGSGGKAYQKVIVRDTGFSKAKVSRLLKSLKERGIIEIEPVSGRENRVILVTEKKKNEGEKE